MCPFTMASGHACPRRTTRNVCSRRSAISGKRANAISNNGDGNVDEVVIVGAGWAGFGAAKHLAEQGVKVKLLDLSPNPGGLSAGWRTKDGKMVEAGMKGFWYQYPNIFALVKELGVPHPFTPFTTSGFWTPDGLSVSAPVFSQLPQLPALLGQFIHTSPLFRRLPLSERLTMLPWLYATIDYDATPATYSRYDAMSARDMFRSFGVSKRMYEEFIKPTLLVGLFAPPEELSAAVTMGCLYYYALQHQNSFDVCWCKGSIAERIFTPLVSRIEAAGGQVLGRKRVVSVNVAESGHVTSVTCEDTASGAAETFDTDAVIFAVGVTGMQRIVAGSPGLAARSPELRRIAALRGIDVVATRLWLDRRVPTQFPANVLAGFEDNVGSTYFNLNELQDEYRDSGEGVIASDFYYASTLLSLSDDEIVAKVKGNLDACEPAFSSAHVADAAVFRAPRAVTHFSPGSYANRPPQVLPALPNVFMAGDWVKGVPHGANGLSQERAFVTGLFAANHVLDALKCGAQAVVLPVEPDEAHIDVGRRVNSALRSTVEKLGLDRSWI